MATMFLLDLFRHMKGYVKFEAKGGFIERFLNLCARNRIPIWNGRKRGDTYAGYTAAKNYRKLRSHAKTTGVRIHVLEKTGAPFQRRKYRRRVGLLTGFAVFAGFLAVMSCFVWRIEVNGLETVEESRVISVLSELGVKPGVMRGKLDIRECERLAMLNLHEFSWIALNMDGSTIYVEVSESVVPPPMADPARPGNIVATKTGQIKRMNIFVGQALLREGDTVMAGDVIISGITRDKWGQNLFRHAQAVVIAEITHEITVEVPLEQTILTETGKIKKRTYLGAFSLDLPLHPSATLTQPYHVRRERSPLVIFGAVTPLSLLREEYVLLEEEPVTYTQEQAKDMALDALAKQRIEELGDAVIIDKSAQAKLEKGVLVLHATYECELDIAQEQEILLGENE